MADQGKKVEVRFGAFSCSIEGYDDPVAQMRDILSMMQKMIAETPALANRTPEFDPEPIADALSTPDDEAAPGVVVIRHGSTDAVADAEDAVGSGADRADPAPQPDNGEPDMAAAVAHELADGPDDERAPWKPPEIAADFADRAPVDTPEPEPDAEPRGDDAHADAAAGADTALPPVQAFGADGPGGATGDTVASPEAEAHGREAGDDAATGETSEPEAVNIFAPPPEEPVEPAPGGQYTTSMTPPADPPADPESIGTGGHDAPAAEEADVASIFAPPAEDSAPSIFAPPPDAPAQDTGVADAPPDMVPLANAGEPPFDPQEQDAPSDPSTMTAPRGGFESLLARVHGERLMGAPGEAFEPAPEPQEPSTAPDPETLAARAGDASVSGLLGASAAWLTLIKGQTRFSRRDVMEVLERIPADAPRELADRIKGFGKLVRSGSLVLVDDGTFAMSQPERERYRALVAQD